MFAVLFSDSIVETQAKVKGIIGVISEIEQKLHLMPSIALL